MNLPTFFAFPAPGARRLLTLKRMQVCAISVALILLHICSVAHASEAITLPFTLHGMHIYINGAINGVPAVLVLDSGAGANVVTPQEAKKLGLKMAGSGLAVGAGDRATSVQVASLSSLTVGGARMDKQTAYIIPLPDALACDGLLGTPFFRQWVVTIDYDASRITLTPKGRFTPSAETVAFHTEIISETIHVQATVDGKKGLFKLDTGAGDTLTLFSPFVARNGLRNRYSPAIKMITGRGVGGLVYGDAVRIPSFSIGPFEFKGVAATLSRQTQGAFADPTLAGNIGEAVLERFKVTFDDSNNRLYLSKGARFDRPFVGNRTGIATDFVDGVIYARSVIANSPASEAGILEGDAIISIGDSPSGQLHPWDLRDLLSGEVGSQVRLRVRSGAETPRDVSITLRDLY